MPSSIRTLPVGRNDQQLKRPPALTAPLRYLYDAAPTLIAAIRVAAMDGDATRERVADELRAIDRKGIAYEQEVRWDANGDNRAAVTALHRIENGRYRQIALVPGQPSPSAYRAGGTVRAAANGNFRTESLAWPRRKRRASGRQQRNASEFHHEVMHAMFAETRAAVSRRATTSASRFRRTDVDERSGKRPKVSAITGTSRPVPLTTRNPRSAS